uniref:Tegument serine/threonine protein kinase n=2 Tax=Human herpesvirus 2 TaxID=10310 RepID=A0A1U9ZI93_HHV2|nr:tegument serine/threonine protein kinase [Human alphaherpesvirus 2]AQZ58401.1 tegument serine/threonine protein kinase [Human alphaherpesvirus 2]
MDESGRQRPASHVAADISPQGAHRRSFKAWLASYIHSLSRRASGRPSGPSPRDGAVSGARPGSRRRSSFRERLRAGLSRWRVSRSSRRRSSPEAPGPAAKLRRPPLRRSETAMTSPPSPPSHILSLARIHKLCIPVFAVNPALRYTTLEIPGARSFGGSGGYGEVQLIREHKLAVKTIREKEWFAVELVATLLVGECALRGGRTHDIRGFITPLGFSLQQRQIVFPAYDMDLGKYIGQLASLRATTPSVATALHHCFTDLARAVVFLNTKCGISHLDIKCANVLVMLRSDAVSLRRAVLADFSLVTLNSNSTISRGQFCLQEPDLESPRGFGMPAALTTANFHTLVGHGYNQPPELLVKYLNNERAEFNNRPLKHDVGLAVDLYALGQTLLELLVSVYVAPSLGVPVTRVPGYQYFNNQLSPDFAVALLAYRCVLHPALFVNSAETNTHGLAYDVPEGIRRHLRNPKIRRAFTEQCINYQRTHKAVLSSVSLPPELRPLLVLVSRLCHANPAARHSLS